MTQPARALPASTPAPPRLQLQLLDPTRPHTFVLPAKKINEGEHLAHFRSSQAYRDIGTFIYQLNRAVCPRRPRPAAAPEAAAPPETFPLRASSFLATTTATATTTALPGCIAGLQGLLRGLAAIVDEVPPDPGPRRFGNVSFRAWHRVLEERVEGLFAEALPEEVLRFGASGDGRDGSEDGEGRVGPVREIMTYFLGAFGSAQRLDYGTGHELSFLAFLGCLWKLGFFKTDEEEEAMERRIVLDVIQPYIDVVRRLIQTYTLEPAGSHGVWGLDDHFFLPFIFGSAQLTRPISDWEDMPKEGSVKGAPRTGDVAMPAVVERERASNMYFSAIAFIHSVKKGPFWEHSPMLWDISGVSAGWGKINKGMILMYDKEVLDKFPVVQHFPFGSLFSWDLDLGRPPTVASPTVASGQMPSATMMPPAGMPGTGVPSARMPPPPGPALGSTRMPRPAQGEAGDAGNPDSGSSQMPMTKAPWAK